MNKIEEMFAQFGLTEAHSQQLKSFSHSDPFCIDIPDPITIETILVENGQARQIAVEVSNAQLV